MFATRVLKFHRKCGDRVTLLNDNTTAMRNSVEFNHGLILSAEPLRDDIMFEIIIDRKVNVWNGSIEIGVTTLDPETMVLPATATKLRGTAWIMSGNSVVMDGETISNSYGQDLDSVREGDTLGVIKSSQGELMFFMNGRCLGIAARELPPSVFAVIDLYGQCVQVTILNGPHGPSVRRALMESSLDQIEEDPNDIITNPVDENMPGTSVPNFINSTNDLFVPISTEAACATVPRDSLRFHMRCGILVILANNNKTAERARPMDDYNNGVVMTHRPLYDNELFEITIDRLVDKWSGSIEVGVTTHDPATMRFPSTMTNMETGTIMMSGCKVLVNGQGTCMEYGNFNLDELKEGDTIGMMRKSNGHLHYFINGVDQGVATDKVDETVWGVIDLYGMTTKVSIVDPILNIDATIMIPPPDEVIRDVQPDKGVIKTNIEEDILLFHSLRDSNVAVINNGKTAHRPNAFEFFNNGVVMTNRTLKTNELFQVRLDLIVAKWAGSIEIGVTQLTCNEIKFPFKMSNAKTGTWALTGEDVIRDGMIIIPQYTRNLNKLTVDDTVGVVRKDNGILHFYVNGRDQGPAAFNIPEHVFGVVDLYGRVAKATILHTRSGPLGIWPMTFPDLCFHRATSDKVRLLRHRMTAARLNSHVHYDDALVFSSRPLRENETFEIKIDKLSRCWKGSLEFGITAVLPEELEATGGVSATAKTTAELNCDTYFLTGDRITKDGECVRTGYPLNLDKVKVGSRIGVTWYADRSVHYSLNGRDKGKAWYAPHSVVYAAINLYGNCLQVSVVPPDRRYRNPRWSRAEVRNLIRKKLRQFQQPPPPPYLFSEYHGDNITMYHNFLVAKRKSKERHEAILFSAGHLLLNEVFEIKVRRWAKFSTYGSSLRIGITDINILNAHVNRNMPASLYNLPHYTAFIDGDRIKTTRASNRMPHRDWPIAPSFDWLYPGDVIGFKKRNDGTVQIYFNHDKVKECFKFVPEKVYVCIELNGNIKKVQAISRMYKLNTFAQPISSEEVDGEQSSEITAEGNKALDANNETTPSSPSPEPQEIASTSNAAIPLKLRKDPLPYTFHHKHGENIKLCSSDTVAVRTSSYEDAVAVVSQPLLRGHHFRFRVDKINNAWTGSVSIGAVAYLPKGELPKQAFKLQPPSWVISNDMLIHNGALIPTRIASYLNKIEEQSTLTLYFGFGSELMLNIDGRMIGVIARISRSYSHIYPVIDLYGKVQQISILLHRYFIGTGLSLPSIKEKLNDESPVPECELDSSETELDFDSAESISIFNKVGLREMASVKEDDAPSAMPVSDSASTLPSQMYTDEVDVAPRSASPQNESVNPSDMEITDSPQAPSQEQAVRLPFDYDAINRSIQNNRHASMMYTSNFSSDDSDLETEIRECIRRTFTIPDSENQQCDTNILHNDLYPEVGEIQNLTNAMMELPDLTEERSFSEDSTRRNAFDPEPECLDNLRYLHRVLSRSSELEQAESALQADGEGCEHLHLVFKFWSFLTTSYPDLRQAVSNHGLMQCYCTNCKPDANEQNAGWVYIQRTAPVDQSQVRFWHVERSTVAFTQAGAMEPGPIYRPSTFVQETIRSSSGDIWFDEEGKPHHTVVALEIEMEPLPSQDRLIGFMIFFHPNRQDDSE